MCVFGPWRRRSAADTVVTFYHLTLLRFTTVYAGQISTARQELSNKLFTDTERNTRNKELKRQKSQRQKKKTTLRHFKCGILLRAVKASVIWQIIRYLCYTCSIFYRQNVGYVIYRVCPVSKNIPLPLLFYTNFTLRFNKTNILQVV